MGQSYPPMMRNFHLPFSSRAALYFLGISECLRYLASEDCLEVSLPMHPNGATGKKSTMYVVR